jgi:hypothetical protein
VPELESAPKSYAAADPRAALEMLGQERLAEIERERVRTRAAVDRLTEELGPVFAAGKRQNDPLAYVEVLSGPARIAHRPWPWPRPPQRASPPASSGP